VSENEKDNPEAEEIEIAPIFEEDWGDDHRSGVVAVVGKPNAGKSTLVNYILGQKIAIVTPTPETTRQNQMGIYTTDTVQILFLDTPGIHDPHTKLGEYMVRAAQATFADADVVLWVVDVSLYPTSEDRMIAEMLQKTITPVILAMNKSDLISGDERNKRILEYYTLLERDIEFLISATQGTDVDKLTAALAERMPLGPRYYPKDQVSDQNLRFIAAEVIRERIIVNTHDEIPHAVAVGIDEFYEKDNGKFEIDATIYVERNSQKGIVIGKKGSMIKQLGIEAREELTKLFRHEVLLYLHVKVLPNWRSEESLMKRFGYTTPGE